MEVVLVVLGGTQRRGLSVDHAVLFANVGSAQNTHPLSVGGHDAVLNAIMHHLDKVTGAVWAAVQITLLGGAANLLTSRGTRYVAHAGSQPGEDGIEVLDHLRLTPNHHAVPALQAPNTTAGPHVHIVDPLRRQFPGA